MTWLLERARPEIVALTPYASARREQAATAQMLNANESPWAPAFDASGALNRYPDPQPAALRKAMAALYGAAPEQVLLGRGSDEGIDLLLRVFCRAGQDAVITCPPTFGFYAVAARVQGAAVREVPLTPQGQWDEAAIAAACDDAVRLVFLCNPNNPTGEVQPLARVAAIANALQGRALVVVDEAYGEFSGEPSATTLMAQFDNIAVLRTLSKAHALAGARLGALIAPAPVVELAQRVQAPYPLPAPCVAAALAALTPAALAATGERVARLVATREVLRERLLALPGVERIWPSATNFLCVRFADAPAAMARLLAAGIAVRDFSRSPQLAGCLRITAGDEAQMNAVVNALSPTALEQVSA